MEPEKFCSATMCQPNGGLKNRSTSILHVRCRAQKLRWAGCGLDTSEWSRHRGLVHSSASGRLECSRLLKPSDC